MDVWTRSTEQSEWNEWTATGGFGLGHARHYSGQHRALAASQNPQLLAEPIGASGVGPGVLGMFPCPSGLVLGWYLGTLGVVLPRRSMVADICRCHLISAEGKLT